MHRSRISFFSQRILLILLVFMLSFTFLLHFDVKAVRANATDIPNVMKDGHLTVAGARIVFQCGVGIAFALATTLALPGIGVALSKYKALSEAAAEIWIAVKAARNATLAGATEAEVASEFLRTAQSLADRILGEYWLDTISNQVANANEAVAEAKATLGAKLNDILTATLDHFSKNILSNIFYDCVMLFFIPYVDKLAVQLFPGDPAAEIKELNKNENKDDAVFDQNLVSSLLSNPGQLCLAIGAPPYDAANDSCGNSDVISDTPDSTIEYYAYDDVNIN